MSKVYRSNKEGALDFIISPSVRVRNFVSAFKLRNLTSSTLNETQVHPWFNGICCPIIFVFVKIAAALDALTDTERARFSDLNQTYVAKHGFPFIIAVRDHTKASILQAFETRIHNASDIEFATACGQVERIALLRLKELLP